MQSKTSWFNGTLFKKNFTRFWPVWILYLVIWAFALPFTLLAQMTRWPESHADFGGAFRYFADAYVLDTTGGAALSAAVFGVLAAMAVFSYLYNNRSAGMFHALPVTREGLFLTNYLSGLLFLVGPAVAVFFLTLGAEAIVGAVNVGALCMWLVVHLLAAVFFYSFAVFCAMFTGNILALPAFYGVLNLLAFALYQVVEFILDQFLFGYWRIEWLQSVAEWLTPCWRMSVAFRRNVTWHETMNQITEITYVGLTTALIFGVVGIVLAVAALILYRKRHLESAGDVVSVSWVRPIFKHGVGVCAALVLGTLLYGWFGRAGTGGDFWRMFCFLLPCGAVGYFAAEMLLKKSFRAFEHWKGCLVMLAAVALFMGAVRMDAFGYGSRVPKPEEVKSVSLSAGSTAPYDSGYLGGNQVEDEDYIRAVLDLHAAIVAEKSRVRSGGYGGDSTQPWPVGGYETYNNMGVSVTYELKNGGTISRNYYLPLEAERLTDPGSYDAKLQALSGFPELMLKNYGFYDESDTTYKLVEAELPAYNTAAKGMETVTLAAEEAALLRDAVKSDLAAGRLGQRFLMNDEARMNTCYANDISFYFLNKDSMDAAAEKDITVKEASSVTTVTVLTTATDTIAALEKLGVLDETHVLKTQEEMRQIEQSEPDTVDAERTYLG